MSQQSSQHSSDPEQNLRSAIRLLVSWLDAPAELQPGSAGVRIDQVVAIRDRLATGTYKISLAQVAEKIIECLLKPKL